MNNPLQTSVPVAVSHHRPDIEFICLYSAICVPFNFENRSRKDSFDEPCLSASLNITRCYFPLLTAQLLLCILVIVTLCKYSVMCYVGGVFTAR